LGRTIETLTEVCLELFPRKVTAKIEPFRETGAILTQFFGFLEEHQFLKTAGKLQREMRSIAPEMVRLAKDPRNWGMAKSLCMEALKEGVDLSNAQAMNDFITNFNTSRLPPFNLPGIGHTNRPVKRPVAENPFKNMSRNQVIKVKYPDGCIREGKFKRLEEELRAGKCEWLS